MKLPKTHSLTILAMALASAHLASGASTLILTPTDDSLIRAGFTNQDGGLVLVGDTTTANDFLRGAFAFNLTSPLLTGATINSVTLTLTIDARDTGGSANETVTLNLHQLSASFTNGGVTWTSRDGTNNWTTPGGDFGGVLASDSANADTVNANDTVDFTSAALASAAESAIGGSIYFLAKLDVENDTRNIFRFKASNLAGSGKPTLTIDYIPEPSTALLGALGMLCLLRRRR